MANLDKILYRPSWQRLRVSCLAENNPYGGMVTSVGANDAMSRMLNYINDADASAANIPEYTASEISSMNLTPEIEKAGRMYRVANFMQATINGLISQPGHSDANQMKNFYDSVQHGTNMNLVAEYGSKWRWEVVRAELEQMFIAERYWFTAIRADMTERIKEKGNKSEELFYFVGIMDEINR